MLPADLDPFRFRRRDIKSPTLRPVGGIGETQTPQTDSGGSGGRRNRLDCRLFFREQSERCTIGIERLKATAAAKDEAQAAVRTRQDGDHARLVHSGRTLPWRLP